MYRVAIESILGLQLTGGDTLELRPCLPSSWPGYRARYRLPDGRTVYEIAVSRAEDADDPTAVWFDDEPLPLVGGTPVVPLVGDGARHRIILRLAEGAVPHYVPASSSGEPVSDPPFDAIT
jgi:cyclic beta-1,2-glucan synthetase